MKKYELEKLGVPNSCLDLAIEFIKRAGSAGGFSNGRRWGVGDTAPRPREVIDMILANPSQFVSDPLARRLAEGIIEDSKIVVKAPAPYKVWGEDQIELNAVSQMVTACSLPVAERGALMPDAHLGYGLPIGGVLATLDAVIPYAVGVDIACRMKLTVIDIPVKGLESDPAKFERALLECTKFGKGCEWETKQRHDVMDLDWKVSDVTRRMKDTAHRQLGTSGSGNHFVEFGTLSIKSSDFAGASSVQFDGGQMMDTDKKYIAILSHSGSRGVGSKVCDYYSKLAAQLLPHKYKEVDGFKHLAWLEMSSEPGQEYWAAMNLMGEYAKANHDVIHHNVVEHLGARVVWQIENHHNFAWKETHNGKEYIVHRKGATPAGEGVFGVIPGSMADPAYVVTGKGTDESLRSASHGAGRRLGRNQAKAAYSWDHWSAEIKRRGVRLLSAGIDEVPGVYKDINDVMKRQEDLVSIVARFDPKIVRMAGEGEQAED
jgi:tRNA-splicing ligase RtcB